MKKYDYIIVGDGVAARCVLAKLVEHNIKAPKTILQISDNVSFPACSERTTSMVPIDVFSQGLSKLGDTLYTAHEYFENSFSKQGHAGVNPVSQYHMPPGREVDPLKQIQFETRFGSDYMDFRGINCVRKYAYQVNAPVLLADLKTRFQDEVVSIKGIVTGAKSGAVSVDNVDYICKQVILCTSAYTKFFFQHDDLPEGKGVKGTFLDFQNVDDLGIDSFVLSKGHYNFSYDRGNKSVLFGANSVDSFSHLDTRGPVTQHFKLFSDCLDIHLSLEDAKYTTGVRHKGRRRMPVFAEVAPGITVISSLYKNGWALAPYFANEYVNLAK